jgi:hypothetical protein
MRVKEKSRRVVRQNPDSWDWLDAIAGTLDEDFLKAVLESSQEARNEAIKQDTADELFS